MISTLLLIIIYIAFISLGLPDALLGSAWPAMYEGMGVPISYAGFISAIVSGGTIISSLFSNKMIQKYGTGKVTLISVFMTAAALFGFAVSGQFFMFCLLAVPLGLGAGSVDAALNNYVALHYKARHMSWLHCFWGIGATMGPIIMAFRLESTGIWSEGYLVISIIQLGLTILLFLTLSLWNGKQTEDTLEQEEKQEKDMGVKELLKLPGAKPALVSFFCYCAVEATTGLWGSSYLVMIKGISPETAAKWISLYYFGITFGRFLSGFFTVKWNNRQMVRIGLGVLSLGVLLFLLPVGAGILQLGFFLIGMGCAPIYPCLLHETPKNFGAQNSQAIMGIQMACAYVGTTIVPPIFGFLASVTSYKLFPFYVGIILVLMIFMTEKLNYTIKMRKN